LIFQINLSSVRGIHGINLKKFANVVAPTPEPAAVLIWNIYRRLLKLD
jgi:hypothetical protein